MVGRIQGVLIEEMAGGRLELAVKALILVLALEKKRNVLDLIDSNSYKHRKIINQLA